MAYGELIAAAFGTVAVGVSAVSASFVFPAFRRHCLPYVPATTRQLANIVTAIQRVGVHGPAVDLGSGDGRVAINVARKCGLHCSGFELNSWLVLYSRMAAYRQGQASNTRFLRKNLWKANLKDYSSVIIFGTETLMSDFQNHLDGQKYSGVTITCRFPLPTWEPSLTVGHGIDRVWAYDCRAVDQLERRPEVHTGRKDQLKIS